MGRELRSERGRSAQRSCIHLDLNIYSRTLLLKETSEVLMVPLTSSASPRIDIEIGIIAVSETSEVCIRDVWNEVVSFGN